MTGDVERRLAALEVAVAARRPPENPEAQRLATAYADVIEDATRRAQARELERRRPAWLVPKSRRLSDLVHGRAGEWSLAGFWALAAAGEPDEVVEGWWLRCYPEAPMPAAQVRRLP